MEGTIHRAFQTQCSLLVQSVPRKSYALLKITETGSKFHWNILNIPEKGHTESMQHPVKNSHQASKCCGEYTNIYITTEKLTAYAPYSTATAVYRG